MVGAEGLEPSQSHDYQILSLTRLPLRHAPLQGVIISIFVSYSQGFDMKKWFLLKI